MTGTQISSGMGADIGDLVPMLVEYLPHQRWFSAKGQDHGDVLGHRFAGGEECEFPCRIQEGGRLSSIDQPSALVLTQSHVQRQERHAAVPTSVHDLDPRRTGWELDREQFAGGQTERRLHAPSVPARAPPLGASCLAAYRDRAQRDDTLGRAPVKSACTCLLPPASMLT